MNAIFFVFVAFIILAIIAGTIVYFIVLINLFKEKGVLHALLGWFFWPYLYIWGWANHRRLKLTKLMVAWTAFFFSPVILAPLGIVFMPNDMGKPMKAPQAVKVVEVGKEPATVRAPKRTAGKVEAAAEPMVAVSAENRQKSAEWSAKAQALWKDGKYTEPENALRYLDLAVGLNPNDALLYNNRGLTKRDLGRYEKAVEDYSRAIALNPKYAVAYNNRGVANYELAQYEKAIKDYTQAIRIDPKYVDAYFNQALANYQLDEIDRMCNFFEKACELGACDGLNWAKQENLCK